MWILDPPSNTPRKRLRITPTHRVRLPHHYPRAFTRHVPVHVGLALRAGVPLGLHLSTALYKLLQSPGKGGPARLGAADLAQLEPRVAAACAQIAATEDVEGGLSWLSCCMQRLPGTAVGVSAFFASLRIQGCMEMVSECADPCRALATMPHPFCTAPTRAQRQ